VAVVDQRTRPAVGTVSVRQNGHRSDLDDVRQTAVSARSAPACDLAVLSGVVAGVGGRQVGVPGVGVGRDVLGPSDGSDVVRVTIV